jgi:hypothetical protein
MHILPAAILASLTNELTRADAEQMVAGVLGGTKDRSPMLALFRLELFPLAELEVALRAAWQSRRGHEYARRIAFRDISQAEMLNVQVVLGLVEGCRAGAFGPGKLSPGQDELLWQLFSDACQAQFRGELTHEQIVQIVAAWAGISGEFGWATVARKLSPSLRGGLAYVMGNRYLRKNWSPQVVAHYFRTARDEAPAGSVLRRLAEAELARLERKKADTRPR